MKQVKLLIVDDSQIVLEGLKFILKQNSGLQIIAEAHTKQEVMQCLSEMQPDIILLDICLEREYDGIDVCKDVMKLYPAIRIIMLSQNKDKKAIINSIRAGARAYLAKDTSGEEIGHTIQLIINGKGLFLGETIPHETLIDCFGDTIMESTPKPYHLTEREIEIIEYLSKGYCSKDIAEMLFINTNTIESHKEHIKEKLNMKTIVEIVVFAIKNHLISIN